MSRYCDDLGQRAFGFGEHGDCGPTDVMKMQVSDACRLARFVPSRAKYRLS
jgi:hypothetical protein